MNTDISYNHILKYFKMDYQIMLNTHNTIYSCIYSCFATTNKWLENILAEELTNLGATNTITTNAGVKFDADFTTIMRCNLHSRIASRIMIQVGFGGYRNEDDIYSLAFNIKWADWFDLNNNIKVATNAINSPLRSLEFVTLKVKDAICDNFSKLYNERPNVNKYAPDMRIYNFLTMDTITIYLDTSDEGLFKRGYRQNTLEAPLKENLAAGLLKLANWQPHIPLYDPMCGSGTIPMEAISIGLNIAPGLNRGFAFEKFVCMINYEDTWHKMKSDAKNAINYNNQSLKIYASDINQQAINATHDNLKRAKLLDYITLNCGDFLQLPAPNVENSEKEIEPIGVINAIKVVETIEPAREIKTIETKGMILTNPPYGVRLDELENLADFYPKLASHLKQNYAGWVCYFLTADLRMPKLMRLKPSRKTPVFNGALECRLFEFKMVSGSNR